MTYIWRKIIARMYLLSLFITLLDDFRSSSKLIRFVRVLPIVVVLGTPQKCWCVLWWMDRLFPIQIWLDLLALSFFSYIRNVQVSILTSNRLIYSRNSTWENYRIKQYPMNRIQSNDRRSVYQYENKTRWSCFFFSCSFSCGDPGWKPTR